MNSSDSDITDNKRREAELKFREGSLAVNAVIAN